MILKVNANVFKDKIYRALLIICIKTHHPRFLFADCGAITNIINGTVSTPEGTLEDANATYNCSSGYVLIGVATRTCVNGNWSGTLPKCLKGKHLVSLHILHALQWHIILKIKANVFKDKI